MPSIARRIAPLIASALLLAGCSGESQEQSDESLDATSTTAVTETTAPARDDVAVETTSVPDVDAADSDDADPVLPPLRVGLSLDLSGPLSSVDSFVLDAQLAYFDDVNQRGGIGDRLVEVVALDHASDLDTHRDNIAELLEESERGVTIVSSAGGDELAAAAAPLLADAGAVGISRGHVRPAGLASRNVATIGRSTCADSYAGVRRLVEQADAGEAAPTLAVIVRDDLYGERSQVGAVAAAEEAEVEVVLLTGVPDDTEAQRAFVADMGDVTPDLVWVAVSPRELADLYALLAGVETQAMWSGAFQSYDALLLESSVATAVSNTYTHTASVALYDHDGADASESVRSAFPDAQFWAADALMFGWQQAELAHRLLVDAASNDQLDRAGVVEALAADGQQMAQTRFYDVDAQEATLRLPLSTPGSTGLQEVPGPTEEALATACDG